MEDSNDLKSYGTPENMLRPSFRLRRLKISSAVS